MSCVLRIEATEPSVSGLIPYRLENGVAHFQVSDAGFEDLQAQISDAVVFLRSNQEQLRVTMARAASSGVLDFAVEWRDAIFQSNRFSPELVREAGHLGLALELSHYPKDDAPHAEA